MFEGFKDQVANILSNRIKVIWNQIVLEMVFTVWTPLFEGDKNFHYSATSVFVLASFLFLNKGNTE